MTVQLHAVTCTESTKTQRPGLRTAEERLALTASRLGFNVDPPLAREQRRPGHCIENEPFFPGSAVFLYQPPQQHATPSIQRNGSEVFHLCAPLSPAAPLLGPRFLSANGSVVRAAGRTTSLTKMRQRPKAFAKAISPDTHAECTPGTARESTSLAITCTSHPEEAHSVERTGACDLPARRGRALLFSRFAHCHGRSTPRVPRMFHWPSSSPCAPPSVTPASPSSGSKRSASEGSSCSPRSSKKS